MRKFYAKSVTLPKILQMKRILIFTLLISLLVSTKAQSPVQVTQPYQYNKYVIVLDSLISKNISLPRQTSFPTPKRTGQLCNKLDTIYYYNGTTWIKLSSETDPFFKASEAYAITSTDKNHWNTAYNAYHTHNNLPLLQSIKASDTARWAEGGGGDTAKIIKNHNSNDTTISIVYNGSDVSLNINNRSIGTAIKIDNKDTGGGIELVSRITGNIPFLITDGSAPLLSTDHSGDLFAKGNIYKGSSTNPDSILATRKYARDHGGLTYTGKVMIDSVSKRQNLPTSKKISFDKLNNQIYPYQMTGNTTLLVDTVSSISGSSTVYQILGSSGSKLIHGQPWSPVDTSNTNRSINTTTGMLYTWLGGCFGSGNYRRFKFNLIDSVLAPGAPLTLNAPGSFQATAASQTQINLSWSLPSPNGRNFQIYDSIVGVSSNFTNLLNSPAKTSTSYNHTGLTNGQHVYYRIRTVGNGTDTLTSGFATANATTSALTTLGTPTLSTPAVISSTEIDLAWSQVTNNSGYKAQISRNGGSTYTDLTTTSTNTNSYNVTTLHADSLYYFKVKALGDNVTYTDGAFSSAQSATTSGSNTILFQDDFAGTSINTSKWTSTINNPGQCTITQNDALIFTSSGNEASPFDYINSTSFANSSVLEIKSDLTMSSNSGGYYYFRAYKDANNFISIMSRANSNLAWLYIWQGGVEFYNNQISDIFNGSWKIRINGNTVSFYRWESSNWVQKGTNQTINFGNSNFGIQYQSALSNTGTTFSLDNAFITNYIFSTQNP